MMLSDYDIVKNPDILIEPWDVKYLQPASVDLHLGDGFKWFPYYNAEEFYGGMDPLRDPPKMLSCSAADNGGWYRLKAGGFCLGVTMEKVTLGSSIAGKLEGKSSLGRLGLTVHSTAGFIDPGFSGHITLEFSAHPDCPAVRLTPGMPIAQITFHELRTPSRRPYGDPRLASKYQNSGPEPGESKYRENHVRS
jgi:dCTP deaminase